MDADDGALSSHSTMQHAQLVVAGRHKPWKTGWESARDMLEILAANGPTKSG